MKTVSENIQIGAYALNSDIKKVNHLALGVTKEEDELNEGGGCVSPFKTKLKESSFVEFIQNP